MEIDSFRRIRRALCGWLLLTSLLPGPALAQAAGGQGDQAEVLLQLLPGEVYSGERFNAMIQMKNSGTNTWTPDAGYHLAARQSGVWHTDRLDLDAPVPPGATATFRARFTAPQRPGDYPFQWQMHKGQRPFGAATAQVMLQVRERLLSGDDAEFVFQEVSQTMLAGEIHQVAVQFKNTSPTPWRAGQVWLTSPDGEGLFWAVERVEMAPGETVEPGGFVVFRFNVQAPLEPGHYPFRWQLQHGRDGLFGRPSEGLVIDVR